MKHNHDYKVKNCNFSGQIVILNLEPNSIEVQFTKYHDSSNFWTKNQVRFGSFADFPDLSASRNQKSHLIRPSYNLKIIKITIFTQKLRLLRIFNDEINWNILETVSRSHLIINVKRNLVRGPTGDRCKTKIEINLIIYYPRYPNFFQRIS